MRVPARRSCCCTPRCTIGPTSRRSRRSGRRPPRAGARLARHGDSPPPATPLRAVEFGDLLVEFADRLDLSNLVVVGNSVGGYAACRLALERPERVAGVVLVNTGGFTPHSVFTRFFCAVMGRPAVVKAVFPVFVRAYMRAKNPADKAVVARVVARARTDDGRALRPHCGGASPNPATTCGTRRRIGAPVLITWGAEDLTAPLRWGKVVRAAIPGSRFRRCRRATSCSRPSRRRGWAGPAVRRRGARCAAGC